MSSCSEYRRCPRRYRYQYVDRVPAPRRVPPAWRYGTVVHRALEAAYRQVREGAALSSTLTRARTAYLQAWRAEAMPDDRGWFDRGESAVTKALLGDTIGPGEVLGVEESFGETLADGIRLAGYADLVLRRPDGAIEVVDHKVTRSVRRAADLAEDDQLNLYGWFARRRWPDTSTVRASHHYPLTGELVTTTLTPASMDETVARLAAVAREAEADGEFVPRPGEHCSHCPWSDICEASPQ